MLGTSFVLTQQLMYHYSIFQKHMQMFLFISINFSLEIVHMVFLSSTKTKEKHRSIKQTKYILPCKKGAQILNFQTSKFAKKMKNVKYFMQMVEAPRKFINIEF